MARARRVGNAEMAGRKPHLSNPGARRYRRDSQRFWQRQRPPRPSLDLAGVPPCLCHQRRA